MDYQFYPTPLSLAQYAWSKFKDKEFTRVLEPSAGNGDLLKGHDFFHSDHDKWWGRHERVISFVDCVEIDASKHAGLEKLGAQVVGHDFLEINDGAIYSHIIMNPPFAEGCKHVLHAWNILYDGEVVAILNAETIRNPFSRERQHLLNLIEQHGSVEFWSEAFSGEEAERKTDVEIAIVHLCKANVEHTVDLNEMLSGLSSEDAGAEDEMKRAVKDEANVAIPRSSIENSVLVFNAAVKAMKEALIAEAKAAYFEGLMSKTLAELNFRDLEGGSDKVLKCHRSALVENYQRLKDKAWTGIIRSGDFTSRLSSKAQRDVEKEFVKIKRLDFTAKNIYGFLLGIVQAQGEIQAQMACDVFDLITKYHEENTCFYMGWKSNTKHNTCGRKIKATRFVIPGHKDAFLARSICFQTNQMLRDFDKVFAMMDGKTLPEVSLEQAFATQAKALLGGERVSSSYFDVRYYPGVGTIHFFARDKGLIDRFNRYVGAQRQWLPPDMSKAPKEFADHYEKAEKLSAEIRLDVMKSSRGQSWSCHANDVMHEEQEGGSAIYKSIDRVMKANGIDCSLALEYKLQDEEQAAKQELLFLE